MALSIDYDSPAFLKSFLEQRGMAMQKKFGQNFLVNSAARKRLIDALDLEDGMTVWEVGPGLGSMTSEILSRGAHVTAFEIDRGFASVIKEIFSESKLRLVEGDVLKTWKKEYEEEGCPLRFFGNLPYNVAAAIVADMISYGARFDKAVITVQKEVAKRITAAPETEDYSSFSVLCQWAYELTPVMDLAGGSFWPRPNVDSRAVKMVKRADFPRCKDPAVFMRILRASFLQRRKTLKNNLSSIAGSSSDSALILESAGIDPARRAETLTLDEFIMLADKAYDFFEEKKVK
ncbi:MAG: 16S rRNA (adenine(1518)-N(6)/adenine(1519)-N(6))-dimethyltransferase RsmA [Treponemataceae bacterium]|nr:16S rRNA (adenine(1518)-N(6)/adenine(1519)-N(6))-dimethyltransferase RsmA [Treponemataceae bacterium]